MISLAMNDTLSILAAGYADFSIRIWDDRTGAEPTSGGIKLSGHSGFVSDLRWNPMSSSHIFSVSHDGTLRAWDIRNAMQIWAETVGSGLKLFSVEHVSRSNEIVVAGEQGQIFKYSL